MLGRLSLKEDFLSGKALDLTPQHHHHPSAPKQTHKQHIRNFSSPVLFAGKSRRQADPLKKQSRNVPSIRTAADQTRDNVSEDVPRLVQFDFLGEFSSGLPLACGGYPHC